MGAGMKRPIVCGSRHAKKRDVVWDDLDRLRAEHSFSAIISGAYYGVDWMALTWAIDRGIPVIGVPAKWAELGKAAGPERNQRMIDDWQPDGCIAFPGGAGTADMVRRAKAAGLPVIDILTRPKARPSHTPGATP